MTVGRVLNTLSSTFVVRSTAIAWTLFALSCNPKVQTTLRAELRTCPTDMPTTDQLNALPYLEGVVREALRLYSPLTKSKMSSTSPSVPCLQLKVTNSCSFYNYSFLSSDSLYVSIHSDRERLIHFPSSANCALSSSRSLDGGHTTHWFSTYSRQESRRTRWTQLGWCWRRGKA